LKKINRQERQKEHKDSYQSKSFFSYFGDLGVLGGKKPLNQDSVCQSGARGKISPAARNKCEG
jgi:hypothetical protein